MEEVVREPGQGRGVPLLLAHCASLDPRAACARERLAAALGPALARRLVSALTRSVTDRGVGRAA